MTLTIDPSKLTSEDGRPSPAWIKLEAVNKVLNELLHKAEREGMISFDDLSLSKVRLNREAHGVSEKLGQQAFLMMMRRTRR